MAIGQIHWLAPATVLGALAAGALFALGHHLYYANLQGRTVHGQDVDLLGTYISSQQLHITVGSVFAFLVNFSLGTALATAYTQLVFRKLMYRKATLETWDAAYGGLANIFFLGKVWIWWQFPLLCSLALIGWLLPLASTISPGTLSVGIAPLSDPPVLQHHVPTVDFTSLNYVADMPRASQGEDSERNTMFEYQGPSPDVVRIANSVGQTGSILQINSPYPNVTWTLDFEGPAISCTEVPASTKSIVQSRIRNALYDDDACVAQGFIAWNDTSSGYVLPKNQSLSFNQLNNGGLAFNLVAFPHMRSSFQYNPRLGRSVIMTLDLLDDTNVGGIGAIPYLKACQNNGAIGDEQFSGSTMIQCQLRNMTYHASFNYVNGEQNILITTETISDEPIRAIPFVAGNSETYDDNLINGVDCSVLSGVYDVDPGANPNNICLIDTFVLKTMSYQAIFQAFEDLIIGTVNRTNAATTPDISTNIQSTILADTSSLDYLNPAFQTGTSLDNKPLQEYIRSGNVSLYDGLVNNVRASSAGKLIPTIETLFQNITISMMSSRVLQPNLTSAFAPGPVQITLHNFHDVYVYSAARLWLAYGLAIAFTALTVAIGIWAVLKTGASYSQDFSTVLRIGRGAEMSTEIKEEDLDGKDKLPKYLEQAQVWVRPLKTSPAKPKVEKVHNGAEVHHEDMSPNTEERVTGDESARS